MLRARQKVKVRRWTGIYSNAKSETGIGPLAKQKAGLVLAMDPRLSGGDVRVGLFLLDAVNTKTGRCDWAIPNIARELTITERTVRRGIQNLKKCKYLGWKRHGGYSCTNQYLWQWEALFSEAEEVQAESEEETKRVHNRTEMSETPDNYVQNSDRDVHQIREEKDNKKENVTTNQKEARQKQEGRRKTERTRQPSQFGLRTFSVVKGGYDAATASGGVAHIKARERVQKVLSENSLWGAAIENDSAFEAAILAEKKKPGTCLQAFNAALEQSAEDAGKVALCL